MTSEPIKVELFGDFTTGVLARLLANDTSEPACVPVEASSTALPPAIRQALASGDQDAVSVVWTDPRRTSSAFGRAARFEDVTVDEVLADVDEMTALVQELAAQRRAVIVVAWAVNDDRGLGLIDLREPTGLRSLLLRANLRLAEALATTPNVHLVDPTPWLLQAGPAPFSDRQWFTSKVPYTNAVFGESVQAVKAALRTLTGRARKIVLLDLDDTLWGGTVGEDGLGGLVLGGHDAKGEAFVAFQQALKRLTRIGVQLAVVSRNDESVALAAIDEHPEMVLRREDLAGWRINWGDKAENIRDLLEELNLGTDAAVFIDNSAFERGRVREALPDVLVPDLPDNPMLYAATLRALDCFDQATISADDRARTASYVSERERRRAQQSSTSLDDWLASLELVVSVRSLDDADLPRATQLLNKTNQMNLATRRLTEAELAAWAAREDVHCVTVRVRDRFGDSGLTGFFSVQVDGREARIVDLLMSCRVFGRRVEHQILHAATLIASRCGADRLVADLVPTDRNGPTRTFLDESGLTRDGDRYVWDLSATYPPQDHITLEADPALSAPTGADATPS